MLTRSDFAVSLFLINLRIYSIEYLSQSLSISSACSTIMRDQNYFAARSFVMVALAGYG